MVTGAGLIFAWVRTQRLLIFRVSHALTGIWKVPKFFLFPFSFFSGSQICNAHLGDYEESIYFVTRLFSRYGYCKSWWRNQPLSSIDRTNLANVNLPPHWPWLTLCWLPLSSRMQQIWAWKLKEKLHNMPKSFSVK